MGQNADILRELEDEGVGSPRVTKAATGTGDEELSLWPLAAAIGGIVLTLGILVVGLVPTWAVLSTAGLVAAAAAALFAVWWLLRPRPRPR